VEVISDTFYVAYRAIGHYARESQLAACAASTQLAFVTAAVITNQNTETIALVHLAGKIVQLILILPVSRRTFGKFLLIKSIYTAYKLAIRAKAYAIDNLLGSAFGNIDSIVLRAFSGIDVVGIYQSGMRIFQGGAQAAPILANVFLPEMAKQAFCEEKKSRTALFVQASFLTYGLIFGIVLAYFPDQIVDAILGESYKQLAVLLPFFGFLFFIRFFAAAWGIILTATGHQGYRAKMTAIQLMFMLSLGSYLASSLHAQGWLIALILANLLLGILYMGYAVRAGLGISAKFGMGAMLVGGVLFVPRLL
jgi:O-antigen/teichoic acid export membrane protein